jgi:signal transduction histidine kinase
VRPEPTGLERGLLTGLAAFRWAALAWVVVVLVATRGDLSNAPLAAAIVSVAGLLTAISTVLLRRAPAWLLDARFVGIELAVAAGLLIGDRHVYRGAHAQSLGSAWPLASCLSAGVVFGPVGGVTAGVLLGIAGSAGAGDGSVLGNVSSGVLYALAGGVAGFATQRLRMAEQEVATARAREEVARTLHDGVLQTLAVVQRRSTEPELVRLAHEQERELREWLFGSPVVRAAGAGGDLGVELRAAAARFEDRHPSARATVVVADDVPPLPPSVVAALAGAVGEALTNAAKHGAAQRVTVFAEPDDDGGVFCSVKDDGSGFDAAAEQEGVGITSSIRARMAEAGGRAEVDANLGHGTEVRLWTH